MLVELVKHNISEKKYISEKECSGGFWVKRNKPRTIGDNEVVKKAFKKIKDYCNNDNSLFITIFPDKRKNLTTFFDNQLNKWWTLCSKSKKTENCKSRFNDKYIKRFGFIAWEDIIKFCSLNNLIDAKNVLEFNERQIC